MARFFLLLIALLSAVQIATAFTRSPVTSSISNRRSSNVPSAIVRMSTADSVEVAPASGGLTAVLDLAGKLTSSTLYAGIETFIVIGLLAAIDCGFSGDWSRFGYVTTDVEDQVKSAVTSVGLFHFVCAPIAALTASKRGQPVVPAVLHTLAIGGLGLGRVLTQTDETQVDFPNVRQIFTNTLAGKYDVEAVSQSIDVIIAENPVVMFCYSTCPYCIKAKGLLDEMNVEYKVIDLDIDRKVGFPIKAELCKRTGRATVPSIWIGGQFIGGCNDGPKELTLPAVAAVAKGFNFLGFGDKTEAVAAVASRVLETSGGVVALSEGALQLLVTDARRR